MNKIYDIGVKNLVNGLKKIGVTKMRSLVLCHSHINDNGAEILIEFIKN